MRTFSGYHAVAERLKKPVSSGVLYVGRDNERFRALTAAARERGLTVRLIKDADLERRWPRSRGAVLELLEEPQESVRVSLSERLAELHSDAALVLVLDGLTDPNNLGAVLRSADLFDVDAVIVPARRSAADDEVVMRVSSGAAVHVPLFQVPNLVRAIHELKDGGFWIFGADLGGEAVYGVDLSGRTAIVLGSEGRGLSRLVRERCDRLVRIPTGGHIDSLNVSVAAGILLYEARRGWDGSRG